MCSGGSNEANIDQAPIPRSLRCAASDLRAFPGVGPDGLGYFDATLTPTGTQYGAMLGKLEKTNSSRYAVSASLCKAPQHVSYQL